MAEIKWTEGQEEAIKAADKNILVSAAAGSGKTAVLVERVIRKVTDEENPIDIDDLLIMTFTKAAAAQMKEKIRKAVLKALKKNPNDENLRRQVLKISSANIMTIDALCAEIVRDNLENSELDPNVRIADTAELKLMKAEVMADVIESLYASENAQFAAFADYCMERNDIKLETMIDRVYEFAQSSPWPDEWIDNALAAYTDTENIEKQPWFEGIRFMIKNNFDEIIQLSDAALELALEPDGPAKYIGIFTEEREFFERIKGLNFEEAYDEIKFMEFKTMPRMSKNDTDVDEEKQKAAKALRDKYKKVFVDKLQKGIFSKSPEEYIADLLYTSDAAKGLKMAVKEFSEEFKKAKARKQIASFSDIAHAAVNALVSKDEDGNRIYSDAALRMRKRFKEIIVDEYQDTNRLQEEIITAIGGNSVFMVGDVKQSIYAFRMACPDLFVEKYDAYEKDDEENKDNKRIVLGENFRSRSEILDFTNLIFSQIMVKDVGGIAYDENNRLNFGAKTYAEHPLPKGAETEVCFVDESGKRAKVLEALVIREKINEIMESGKVWDEDAKDFRDAQYSDIVILTRNKENPEIEDLLELSGIPVIKQSGKGYFDRLEVRLTLNLFKIIDNPYQDIPFTAVLHSPVVNISADELADLKASYEKPKFCAYDAAVNYKGDAVLEEKLQRFLGMLADFRRKAKYLSVYDLLEYIYEESGLYDIVSAMPQGESRRANLDILKNTAFNFSQSTYSALFAFNRYIEQIREQQLDYGSAQASNDKAGAVRLMTIHASKGLEFPYVILAKCGKKFNMDDFKGDFVCDRDYGVALKRKDRDTRRVEKTLIWHAIEHKKKCDTIAEEIRILYVALTRAKEKLIITGTAKNLEAKKADCRREAGMKNVEMKPYMILDESTYLGLMMKALSRSKNSVESEDEMLPAGFRHNPLYDSGCDFSMRLLNLDELVLKRVGQEIEDECTKEEFADIASEDIDISDLKQSLEYVYPYLEATKTRGKISPSSLEKFEKKMEEDEVADEAQVAEILDTLGKISDETDVDGRKIPEKNTIYGEVKNKFEEDEYKAENFDSVVNQNKDKDTESNKKTVNHVSSAERGTAYHKVFELLDYERGAKEQIEELVSKNQLTKEEAEAISPEKIDSFAASDIGHRMNKALKEGKLKREAEFMMGVDKDGDMVLVQGVIDAYFITEKGIVVVDYKTDRGKKEDEFRKTYESQINCYAEALNRALALPVYEKIIYSVELEREIRL